ncbi:MAG: hypothetical protein ACOXZ9_03760 [Bacteroidales bacterium]|jgi:hypothetical protein
MKKTKILVEHGERRRLMKLLGTTYPTVKTALSEKYFTDLHKKIRKCALDNGGVEVVVK